MAEKLVRYYVYIANQLGLEGRLQLALETKMPETKAALEPDSEENLAVFDAAVAKLTGAKPPERS